MACCKDAAEFFPQMMKNMRWSEGETVLDFGCGNGGSTCKYILPEVQSHNGKFKGLSRHLELLKPGGQIGSVLLTSNTMVFQACRAVAEKRKEHMVNVGMADWTKFEEGKGEETFNRIFKDAGFIVKDLRLLSGREFTIENLDHFKNHMCGFNPFLKKEVSDDLKETLKEEHKQAMLDLVGAANDANTIDCKYEIVYVVAEKPAQ
ncbi:unnamed protein product [Orchesella dallaii]|uniref:Methyltransferase domain-containing protein n=1 Tax=Orchesella dallaii TaxID=48710 RepID=A0ABP1RBA9_9HEXA